MRVLVGKTRGVGAGLSGACLIEGRDIQSSRFISLLRASGVISFYPDRALFNAVFFPSTVKFFDFYARGAA
ncbi:hypothetical protein NDU88_004012 [Pleurodeles waltl]|uniref:Uncharacterized protein n=1 Tax=Pleurodeles waltl TaxID=8319 RepID=A0AAV7QEW0_PLEWA|nr:hypothetical protein NDU88_004012 [Pleurodeles waltl]